MSVKQDTCQLPLSNSKWTTFVLFFFCLFVGCQWQCIRYYTWHWDSIDFIVREKHSLGGKKEWNLLQQQISSFPRYGFKSLLSRWQMCVHTASVYLTAFAWSCPGRRVALASFCTNPQPSITAYCVWKLAQKQQSQMTAKLNHTTIQLLPWDMWICRYIAKPDNKNTENYHILPAKATNLIAG